MNIASSLRAATGPLLRPMRLGGRAIIWTPENLGFGEHLYLLLQAFARDDGTRVLVTNAMRPWLATFPAVLPLVVERRNVRLGDSHEWDVTPRLYQRFGVDFTREHLHAFITEHLHPILRYFPERELVIHVRRRLGEPRRADESSLEAYIHDALSLAGPRDRALVVCDDPLWCRTRLHGVLTEFVGNLGYAPNDPLQQLASVCLADELIGCNSAVSYWGGYASNVTRAEPLIIMPSSRSDDLPGATADQLDPLWQAIQVRPAGLHGEREPV